MSETTPVQPISGTIIPGISNDGVVEQAKRVSLTCLIEFDNFTGAIFLFWFDVIYS